MNNTNRVALNTAAMYVTMLIKIIIGFFTVRIVLHALGEEDYGINNVVFGVVALLDLLNKNMSNTSMRFLAHSLGSGDMAKIKKTFATTMFLHYLIGVVTIVIMEVGGWIMFEYFLNIPEARMMAARIIYQIAVASTFISIIAVPYDAVINAHEHIWVLSVFNVLQSVVLVVCALFLQNAGGDRLIIYGIYCFLIQVLLRIGKVTYSKHHFAECGNYSFKDRELSFVKSILDFTGWSLLGAISSLGAGQIKSIIINNFFGVRLNASEGVAKSISGYVGQFSSNLTSAINPQINKSEGGGDRNRMVRVTEISAKYSIFLFSIIAIPVLFDVPFILSIWLEEVPSYAAIFCRLIIIEQLIDKLAFQMNTAIYAVGKIRTFQIVESTLNLLYLPAMYLLFKSGCAPEYGYYAIITAASLKVFDRFYFGKKIACIDSWGYIKRALLPVLIPLAVSCVLVILVRMIPSSTAMRFIYSFAVFEVVYIALFWFKGIDSEERNRFKGIAKSFKAKLIK